jgi:L-asparaginase type I
MSPLPPPSRRGVLVLVAGGNIGLYVDDEPSGGGGPIARAANTREIAEAILSDITHSDNYTTGSIALRERSAEATQIPVTIMPIDNEPEREERDSAQVDPARWAKLAEKIEQGYKQYEGFVILHGLDTMAYTASALSFMLQNPIGPVVLTGAQLPLNNGRTDAIQNAISSIAIAAGEALKIGSILEVCVYNHDTLFRGNRVTMSSSSSYRSFDSPNYPALAIAGEQIEIQRHAARKERDKGETHFRSEIGAHVSIVDVFPGMKPPVLDAEEYRGVLLRTYGLGTAPTGDEFLAALKALVDANIVVMNVTQARSGRISYGTDPVSLRLMEQGVVSGVDMTAEAAYAKMVVALSHAEIKNAEDARRVADELQIASSGEQSQSVFNLHLELAATSAPQDSQSSRYANEYAAVLHPLGQIVERPAMKNPEKEVEHMQLRLLGVRPLDGATRTRLTVTLGSEDHSASNDVVLGEKEWRWRRNPDDTMNITYEIPQEGARYVTDHDISKTVLRLESSSPITWSRCSISIFVNAYSAAS